MKLESINPELFSWNRRRFKRHMREDSIAVFFSNDLVSSNGETHRRYRQHPDLYFLTGVTQPETVLVMAPKTAKQGFEEVLFIRRPDTRAARLRGPGIDLQQAAQLSGIQQVCFLDELDDHLHELVLLASRIYINSREDRHAYSEAPARDLRFAERLMRLYPAHKYHRAQPILKKIGMVKSAPEVGLIGAAIDLTHAGLKAAGLEVRPGQSEQAIEASVSSAIIAGGANGLAHPIRVAGGNMTLYPEYDTNSNELLEDTLVQVQVGVMYAGYNASVARVFPVNGSFSSRQREVYRGVETCLQRAMMKLVPGTSLPECERQLRYHLEETLEAFGVVSSQVGVHFPAECYAHTGRNLRDPHEAYAPLQSGMVISCAPAVYLPEENFGVLLRNIVLVTDEGPVDLTSSIPTESEAIEEMLGVMA
ncbi:MAG: aminopeptidase P N-terminal domain-containing protein [Saprospiraceae bacterium]